MREEGQSVLGWRTCRPTTSQLGPTARAGRAGHPAALHRPQRSCLRHRRPRLRAQAVRHPPPHREPAQAVAVRTEFQQGVFRTLGADVQREVAAMHAGHRAMFYVPSLSCKTIVYKGMLNADQLTPYFPDLHDPAMESALALVHSRFSTNTFPSWARAHPYRYICPQRRDQHAARQRQLDARPREHVRVASCSATTSRRSCRSSTRAAATRRCSTTSWSCWCWRAGRCRTR